MGTPNFAVMNASNHFVVLTGWDEKYRVCPECSLRHWEYDFDLEKQDCCSECDGVLDTIETERIYPESYEDDDLKANLRASINDLPYDVYDTEDSVETGCSRSYYSEAFTLTR